MQQYLKNTQAIDRPRLEAQAEDYLDLAIDANHNGMLCETILSAKGASVDNEISKPGII